MLKSLGSAPSLASTEHSPRRRLRVRTPISNADRDPLWIRHRELKFPPSSLDLWVLSRWEAAQRRRVGDRPRGMVACVVTVEHIPVRNSCFPPQRLQNLGPLIQAPPTGFSPFEDQDTYFLKMYVPQGSYRRFHARSPTFVLDKFTGDDSDMAAPRWVEAMVVGEEYTIYDFCSVITRLMLKSACRMTNLEEVNLSLVFS